MKKYINISIIALILLPLVVSADQFTGTKDLIRAVGGLINPIIAILAGAALIVFFYGLMKFIFRVGGDEKAVEGGRKLMLWGLLALFVMISVWGIISLMQRELSLPTGTTPPIPPVLTPV